MPAKKRKIIPDEAWKEAQDLSDAVFGEIMDQFVPLYVFPKRLLVKYEDESYRIKQPAHIKILTDIVTDDEAWTIRNHWYALKKALQFVCEPGMLKVYATWKSRKNHAERLGLEDNEYLIRPGHKFRAVVCTDPLG
ncbi:MAG: hypothetical protein R3E76_03910 [Planctomycetota bacterium]